jgi:hypothetical protein
MLRIQYFELATSYFLGADDLYFYFTGIGWLQPWLFVPPPNNIADRPSGS